MNCIDKMYKEIEEIKRREELENLSKVQPFKTIKQDVTFETNIETTISKVDYLSQIEVNYNDWQKKYFNEEKAKSFITFVLKKYVIFNASILDKEDAYNFISKIGEKYADSESLIDLYTNSVNGLLNLIGESEKTSEFFLNPYNAIFKDEKGYYAVIYKGKYSDVKKPIAYPENQLKKVLKEIFEVYAEDFKTTFSSEKERNVFMNSLKAYVNKSNVSDAIKTQDYLEVQFFGILNEHGVLKEKFIEYLDQKGLRLIKVGNLYYNKKPYEEYGEYKKIEFRYWFYHNINGV